MRDVQPSSNPQSAIARRRSRSTARSQVWTRRSAHGSATAQTKCLGPVGEGPRARGRRRGGERAAAAGSGRVIAFPHRKSRTMLSARRLMDARAGGALEVSRTVGTSEAFGTLPCSKNALLLLAISFDFRRAALRGKELQAAHGLKHVCERHSANQRSVKNSLAGFVVASP